MTTAILTHPDCLGHVTPPGHPERVARLETVLARLRGPDFAALDWREAPEAGRAALVALHGEEHVTAIEAAIPGHGFATLDADTFASPGSLDAARRAAGAAIAAVDAVLAGNAENAFAAIRPPGHHAEGARAMGFCLFGNVALAARHALEAHGLNRVAIVDFDVHHGNGTQDLIWNEGRVLFASTHQMPLYPGTGARTERGAHDNILNLPLRAGTNGPAWRRLVEAELLPALDRFAPELILVSAGFDAHRADPLAGVELEAEDFGWITGRLTEISAHHAGGRLVSCLEGGYDLDALGESVAAHVTALMGRDG